MAKTGLRFVENRWSLVCFKVRSQWGKEVEYKPVTTLTSQIFGGGEHISICLGCFQLWPSTARGFRTTTQGFGSFCIGVFYWYLLTEGFAPTFAGVGVLACGPECARLNVHMNIYRKKLQILKSILTSTENVLTCRREPLFLWETGKYYVICSLTCPPAAFCHWKMTCHSTYKISLNIIRGSGKKLHIQDH